MTGCNPSPKSGLEGQEIDTRPVCPAANGPFDRSDGCPTGKHRVIFYSAVQIAEDVLGTVIEIGRTSELLRLCNAGRAI